MKINLIFIICLVSGSVLFDDLNESLKIVGIAEVQNIADGGFTNSFATTKAGLTD